MLFRAWGLDFKEETIPLQFLPSIGFILLWAFVAIHFTRKFISSIYKVIIGFTTLPLEKSRILISQLTLIFHID